MCTSSIMHMCVISIDRYVGIRHPLKARTKTVRVAIYKMAAVWCISLVTASPIILLSVLKQEAVLTMDDQQRFQCAVSNRYFLSYGSLTAFFIPLFIMLFAYSLTIHILKRQDLRGVRRTQNRSAKVRKCKNGAPHVNNGVPKIDLGETPMAVSANASFSVGHNDEEWSQRVRDSGSSIHSSRRSSAASPRRTFRSYPASPSVGQARENNVHAASASCGNSPTREGSRNDIARTRVAIVSPPHSPERKSSSSQCLLTAETPSTTVQRPHTHLQRLAPPTGSIRCRVKLRDIVRKHSAAITAAGIMLQKHEAWRHRQSTVRTERKAVKVRMAILTTNLAACVSVQNLTNFFPYALISTPNVPKILFA